MSTKVILPKGFQLGFNSAFGTLTEDTEVEFPQDHDTLAVEFGIAGRLTDLNGALEHDEEIQVGESKKTVSVKYSPQGSRFEFEVEVKPLTREEELNALKVDDLKALLGNKDEFKKAKKGELIQAVLEMEAAAQKSEDENSTDENPTDPPTE